MMESRISNYLCLISNCIQLSHGVVYRNTVFVVKYEVNLLIDVNNLCCQSQESIISTSIDFTLAIRLINHSTLFTEVLGMLLCSQ